MDRPGSEEADPPLVVVCGVPGAGKTTVAEQVAGRVGADLLRTDVVRKQLFDEPDYADDETDTVYDELLDRAAARLEGGQPVVLDGTFRRQKYRQQARQRAAELAVPFTLVHVECDPAVARERIGEREGDASDADVAIHDRVREEFEPVEGDHVVVDNSGSLSATRQQVDEAFGLDGSG